MTNFLVNQSGLLLFQTKSQQYLSSSMWCPLKRWDQAKKKVNNSDNEPAPRAKLILPDKFTSGWAELGLQPECFPKKLLPRSSKSYANIVHLAPHRSSSSSSNSWDLNWNGKPCHRKTVYTHYIKSLFSRRSKLKDLFFLTLSVHLPELSARRRKRGNRLGPSSLKKDVYTRHHHRFGAFMDRSLPLPNRKRWRKDLFFDDNDDDDDDEDTNWDRLRPIFPSTLRGVCNFNISHLSIFGEIVWGSKKQKDLIVRPFVVKLNMMGKWQPMFEDEVEFTNR